jgi:hypothetical protein
VQNRNLPVHQSPERLCRNLYIAKQINLADFNQPHRIYGLSFVADFEYGTIEAQRITLALNIDGLVVVTRRYQSPYFPTGWSWQHASRRFGCRR